MGYSPAQVRDLQATLEAVDADAIVSGTPIDLTRIIRIDQPNVRVRYDLQEIGKPDLADVLAPVFDRLAVHA